jgi:hypothetical protein
MEPVNVELKVTNVSTDPVLVKDNLLADTDGMTVVVKRGSDAATQHLPYAHYCLKSAKAVLAPGQSMYGSLLVSVGTGGWQIAEPGRYLVQMALDVDGEDVVSNPLEIKVTPAADRQEEHLAQDFFTEDVGRVLTFGGSKVLHGGNDALREVAERMAGHPAAQHARVALGRPYATEYKRLVVDLAAPASAGPAAAKIVVEQPDAEQAENDLGAVLLGAPQAAAETLGHIAYKQEVDRYADDLARRGQTQEAVRALGTLRQTLEVRGVLTSVVASVAVRQAALEEAGT